MKRIIKKAFYALVMLTMAASVVLGCGFSSLAASDDENYVQSFSPVKPEYDQANKENIKISSRFYELIFGKKENEKQSLIICQHDSDNYGSRNRFNVHTVAAANYRLL